MGLGDRIRERRLALRLSQDELARRLGYTSRSTVNKIEKGHNDINQTKIVAFAKALNTTPQYLMGWSDDPSPNYKEETEGDRLKALREQHNKSLNEVANDLHISIDDMKAYESNQKQIPTWVAGAVARYFGIETPTEFHSNRYRKMMEAMGGEILSDEEFDKVIDYVKFIVSQRGK